MIDDVASLSLQTAIHGLAVRQQVTANNIANLETPGFTASTVSFETSLAAAVSAGTPTAATIGTEPSDAPAALNGNNVNLDEETLSNVDTGLRYQLALRAMDDKFGLVRDVIKG